VTFILRKELTDFVEKEGDSNTKDIGFSLLAIVD
jgi:hypothetical protein